MNQKPVFGWAVYGKDYFARPGDKSYDTVFAYFVINENGVLERFDAFGNEQL
jgi:hypothetical protein